MNIDCSGMTANGFNLCGEPFCVMLLYVHVKWNFARRAKSGEGVTLCSNVDSTAQVPQFSMLNVRQVLR